jgi:hypothetical protein
MRAHSTNELIDRCNILDSDGTTVLLSNVPCGINDVTGRRDDQQQLMTAVTQHLVVLRYSDAVHVKPSGYLQSDGVLYIVDYPKMNINVPRPKTWAEIYCHVVLGVGQ